MSSDAFDFLTFPRARSYPEQIFENQYKLPTASFCCRKIKETGFFATTRGQSCRRSSNDGNDATTRE
jgi:hypothetical protein